MPCQRIVSNASELVPLVANALRSGGPIAVDVEGNGLFAYRPRLCTVQLAWGDKGSQTVAIIDTLHVDALALRPLLDASGPVKVLHDLSFDARLLAEAGIFLGNARDTSVSARMLGYEATGLATLLRGELGIEVSKGLQHHDWSQRPLRPMHIEYLGADVEHLLVLETVLREKARERGIEAEIDEECAWKTAAALAHRPSADPPFLRIKGQDRLDAAARAALRRLADARELIAMERDRPPFKVVGNEVLLDVAVRRPGSAALVVRQVPALERDPGLVASLLRALEESADDIAKGRQPPLAAAPNVPPLVLAERRSRHKRLSSWRRGEARARGVDEQVVLPGHCLTELSELDSPSLSTIATVAGLGAVRIGRYGNRLLALLSGDGAPVG